MEKIEKWLKEAENIFLVTHTDKDGICSGALFLKALDKIAQKNAEKILASANILRKEEFYEKISKADLIVFTDLPLDQSWDIANREIGNKKIIIMDHHIPFKNLNSSKIIHINPMFDREVYYPASKIVYDIFHKEITEFDWMAAVGIIGDMGIKDNKKFLKQVMKKYGIVSKKKDMRDNILSKIDELVGSAMMYKGEKGAMECLDICYNSKNPESILRNEKLGKYREKINREVLLLQRT